MFKFLFIYIRAIWNIHQVIDALECAGYIILKDNYPSQTREKEFTEKILLQIGAWKKTKKSP